MRPPHNRLKHGPNTEVISYKGHNEHAYVLILQPWSLMGWSPTKECTVPTPVIVEMDNEYLYPGEGAKLHYSISYDLRCHAAN